MLALLPLLFACVSPDEPQTPRPNPPIPSLELGSPWHVAHTDENGLNLQLANSPDGVRITLGTDERGRVPGISPIRAGKTLEVSDGGRLWPLVAVPFPDRRLSQVEVLVQGVDLVVRFFGPALAAVSDHPEADERPILTQIRIRPRQDTWRIAVEGVTTWSLPGRQLTARPKVGRGWMVESDWGSFALETRAPAYGSALGARWWLDSKASIDEFQPYAKTATTWTPSP